MSDLRKCPFCGKSPHVSAAYGIKYAVCETVGCAMNGKCVPVQRWNTRSEIEVALPSASPNTDSQKCLCTIEDVTHVIGSGHYEGRIIINRACQYHGNCR